MVAERRIPKAMRWGCRRPIFRWWRRRLYADWRLAGEASRGESNVFSSMAPHKIAAGQSGILETLTGRCLPLFEPARQRAWCAFQEASLDDDVMPPKRIITNSWGCLALRPMMRLKQYHASIWQYFIWCRRNHQITIITPPSYRQISPCDRE